MKKYFLFLFVLLILLFVNSCEMQLPSEIHIKGSPSLKLAVELDFSETFKSMMDSAFGSDGNDQITVQNCVNAPENIMTFLIRMKIAELTIDRFSSTFNIDEIKSLLDIVGGEIKLDTEKEIFSSEEDENIELPLDFLQYLDGFLFNTESIKSKIYISGSSIAEVLKIDLNFNTGNLDDNKSINNFTVGKSNIDINDTEYSGSNLPDGGSNDDNIFPAKYLNDDMMLNIDFTIFIDKNKTIKTDMFDDDAKVEVELLIWFPLKFNVPNDGAEFKLIDFDVMGDFFNSISESGIIEEIKLQIEMNENPFKDGDLVITNGNWNRSCGSMTEKTITLNFPEDFIKYINENTFNPNFSIKFDEPEDSLTIPKVLKIETVSVDAVINYAIPIGGGS